MSILYASNLLVKYKCFNIITFLDDVPLTLASTINTFSGSENPILKLVSDAKKGSRKVRIISTYDIDAVVASGVVIKYLLQSDVRYEYLTVLDVGQDVLAEDIPTISFGIQFKELREGVAVVRGERYEVRRLGSNYVINTPYYSHTVLKALEDVMIVTNDVRYYVLTSMLSKYVPRLRTPPPDEVFRSYVRELCDLNLLKVVSGLKIFNYSLVEVDRALSRTLDLFMPGYSGVDVGRDVRNLSEAELSKEVLSRLATYSQVRVSTNDLVGDNYYIVQEWFFKDLYEFLYALMCVVDLYGVDYLVASIAITNYTPLIRLKYEGMLKDLFSSIYKVKDVGIQPIRKNVYKVRLNSLVPLTPICKVLKSYFIPTNSVIVYEVGNEFYTSLSDTPLEIAISLVKGGYERVGNLIRFKELRSP